LTDIPFFNGVMVNFALSFLKQLFHFVRYYVNNDAKINELLARKIRTFQIFLG
jgi:hypothetical protein